MTPMTPDLFSYDLLKIRKTRAIQTLFKADYLVKDLESTLLARLKSAPKDIQKVLIIGCPGPHLKAHFKTTDIDTFDPFLTPNFKDQELPFKDQAYDLVIEGFIFHWLNNPLLYLAEIHGLLRPGGLYLSGFLGGSTLTELRQALLQTDLDLYQGVFARSSPMIKPEAATRLLQTAGFKDPIVDHEEIGVSYPDLKTLIQALRRMGESNALNDQRSPKVSKTYLDHATKTYQKLFPEQDKTIASTFDFVFMTGWRSL